MKLRISLLFATCFWSMSAVSGTSFVCTAQQVYFLNQTNNGQLYQPPNNYVQGSKFVVDRLTGEAQGSLVNTTSGGWEIMINSTGNFGGDWNPSFTYLGQPDVLPENGVSQIVRHTKVLTLALPYTGTVELYREQAKNDVPTFLLMDSSTSIISGTCESL